MAKIMIVPATDYEILKKYLHPNVVLIPESALQSFPPNVQKKAQMLKQCSDVPYDFGDEPDISMDVILCKDSYSYLTLLQDEGGDEND